MDMGCDNRRELKIKEKRRYAKDPNFEGQDWPTLERRNPHPSLLRACREWSTPIGVRWPARVTMKTLQEDKDSGLEI